ncbi:MAG: type II toxin-antitoxin system prevent-host-death family antitoxin [Polyangiaceae bacterium]
MGVHEAKTHLSRLIRQVERGTEVIVVRGGKPVVRIIPATDVTAPQDSYGLFAGQFVLGDDFDKANDDLADLFGIPRSSE